MIGAWETTARYVYKQATFSLSIPYSYSFRPILQRIVYNPQFNCIDIHGTYWEANKSIEEIHKYNPQIFLNNGVDSILHHNLLEKHTEQQLK